MKYDPPYLFANRLRC